MKTIIYFLFALALVYGCASTQNDKPMTQTAPTATDNDTVRIANDSLEYEIIIIEPGFNTFLNSIARPEGYYSQSYLENKNQFLVIEYNQRVQQPFRFDPNLYPQQIDYNSQIDYGYEVNYKLYNYFVYFSRQYNQRFGVPTRI
ncbi:DUF6146 family protein [Leeuwenhoekiella polynyae]|uniref:Uncharacterized protein n=1 Tax=Leeuwenhoekiella polynyae TaxID=1550906 RepID=A0A4Q0P4G0_9FLAO|nr:DUF6146 family protein [Leeuwenhoekiella polynyae]RXG21281.1 hypothetical protein DSM02_2136 [Leeuwenhoekiella polynyae]